MFIHLFSVDTVEILQVRFSQVECDVVFLFSLSVRRPICAGFLCFGAATACQLGGRIHNHLNIRSCRAFGEKVPCRGETGWERLGIHVTSQCRGNVGMSVSSNRRLVCCSQSNEPTHAIRCLDHPVVSGEVEVCSW